MKGSVFRGPRYCWKDIELQELPHGMNVTDAEEEDCFETGVATSRALICFC